jgi:hypothetical protein
MMEDLNKEENLSCQQDKLMQAPINVDFST